MPSWPRQWRCGRQSTAPARALLALPCDVGRRRHLLCGRCVSNLHGAGTPDPRGTWPAHARPQGSARPESPGWHGRCHRHPLTSSPNADLGDFRQVTAAPMSPASSTSCARTTRRGVLVPGRGWQRWFFTGSACGSDAVHRVAIAPALPGPKAVRFAIASILGGAVGNVVDRLLHGYVVDISTSTGAFCRACSTAGISSLQHRRCGISVGAACPCLWTSCSCKKDHLVGSTSRCCAIFHRRLGKPARPGQQPPRKGRPLHWWQPRRRAATREWGICWLTSNRVQSRCFFMQQFACGQSLIPTQ